MEYKSIKIRLIEIKYKNNKYNPSKFIDIRSFHICDKINTTSIIFPNRVLHLDNLNHTLENAFIYPDLIDIT